jgi:hypothetical protein
MVFLAHCHPSTRNRFETKLLSSQIQPGACAAPCYQVSLHIARQLGCAVLCSRYVCFHGLWSSATWSRGVRLGDGAGPPLAYPLIMEHSPRNLHTSTHTHTVTHRWTTGNHLHTESTTLPCICISNSSVFRDLLRHHKSFHILRKCTTPSNLCVNRPVPILNNGNHFCASTTSDRFFGLFPNVNPGPYAARCTHF